ncbi:hypothetical protein ND748_09195 [Frankia sp. AiPs1]|uniref:hypothetical protein n=1 Tax=Frankia sp. AiPs1 TaxID=573493 RepID=UPI002044AEBC|nr:hypothetical protein [Frankia sp. AiPs1]MCM3921832.1 hypothetical protein [Frankia sp. AiPs1]
MTNRLRLGGWVIAVTTCLALTVALVGPVSTATASTPAPSPPKADFGLSVSPTRLVIPQEQLAKDQHFAVSNRGRLPLDIVVNRAAFTAGRDGTLQFKRDEGPQSAMNWITVSPAAFHLEPGTRQVVAVRIAVPPHPEPGDHHVAMLFMVPALKDGKTIRLNRGIGAPLYITVPGPVDDTVRVTSLRTSGFATGGPIDFTATLRNTGTVHRDFRGKGHLNVRVDGRDVAFPDFTVQRGANRVVTARWNDPPRMCVCRAEVTVPGSKGTVSSARARVVLFPVGQAALLVAAVVVILLLGVFIRRRYRARILAEARALRRREDFVEPRQAGETTDSGSTDLARDLLNPESETRDDTPDS